MFENRTNSPHQQFLRHNLTDQLSALAKIGHNLATAGTGDERDGRSFLSLHLGIFVITTVNTNTIILMLIIVTTTITIFCPSSWY